MGKHHFDKALPLALPLRTPLFRAWKKWIRDGKNRRSPTRAVNERSNEKWLVNEHVPSWGTRKHIPPVLIGKFIDSEIHWDPGIVPKKRVDIIDYIRYLAWINTSWHWWSNGLCIPSNGFPSKSSIVNPSFWELCHVKQKLHSVPVTTTLPAFLDAGLSPLISEMSELQAASFIDFRMVHVHFFVPWYVSEPPPK